MGIQSQIEHWLAHRVQPLVLGRDQRARQGCEPEQATAEGEGGISRVDALTGRLRAGGQRNSNAAGTGEVFS
jgi:hypothetical protein